MDEGARELTELLERARRGCPAAARALYDRYGRAVQRAVRRRLARPLRRQFDSADFIQSVWASFFTSPRQHTFASPEALVAFLSQVAYNKVAEKTRQRLGTLRYDISREVPLDGGPSGGPPAELIPAPTPTPSQHAQADDRWRSLVDGLGPGPRRALEMLREGHSHAEIAARLGVDRKAIQRLLERLLRRLD